MKIIKKVLAIFLILAISFQQTQARNFFEDFDTSSLKTSDKAFISERGADGEYVYNLGGSLTLKRQTHTYPLWWNIKPPSINASCSGISFEGMFGTIIDLDKISEQFSEAGASLAWGVLVGIIYSLPGIGEIFQKLTDWANKIQALLANACNAGIAIGKGLGKGPLKSSLGAVGSVITAPSDMVNDYVPDATETLGKLFDCSSTLYENSGPIGAGCDFLKKMSANSMAQDYLTLPAIITSVILKNYKESGTWVSQSSLNEGKIGVFEWKDYNTGNTKLTQDLAFYSIITSAVGDNVVSEEQAKSTASALRTINDDSQNEKEKATAINQLQNLFEASVETSPTTTLTTNSISSVANYLLNGSSTTGVNSVDDTNSSVGTSSSVAEGVRLPIIVYAAQKNSSDAKAHLIVLNSQASAQPPEEILSIIKEYKGIPELAKSYTKCYLSEEQNASCPVSIIESDTAKFYAKVYKNSPYSDRKALETNYVDLVEYEIAQAMLKNIQDIFSNLNSIPNVFLVTKTDDSEESVQTSPTPTAKANNMLVKHLQEFHKKLEKTFADHFASKQANINQATERFKKQNIENLKKVYETNG